MKRILFLIFLVIGLISMAQESEVIYGNVRTDGYDYITKGALWSKRPEAKIIYEGGKVDGFINRRLKFEHYVRFIEGEHNKFDRNYIIFPKGSIVYENANGEIFAAICGNKIEFIRPVTMVKIVEIEKKVEVFKTDTMIHKHVSDTVIHKHVFDTLSYYKFQPPVSPKTKGLRIENGKIRWWHIVVPTAVIAGSILGGFMYLANKKRDIIITPNPIPGGPSGTPTHGEEEAPPVDNGGPTGTPTHGWENNTPPSDTGGPSGTPTYDSGSVDAGGPIGSPTGD
jgi:hypothetical protein